jgi:hypothetical protein
MSKPTIERIEIVKLAPNMVTLTLDWSNDRHQAAKIETMDAEGVRDALRYAAHLVEADMQRGEI